MSYLEGDGSTWKAIPGVARTKEEVLAAAGSRYTYSATPMAYAEAVDLFRITFSPEVVQFSEFQWFKVGEDSYVLRLSNNDRVGVKKDMLDKWHVTGEILTQKLLNSFPAFPEAIRWADDEVRKKAGKSILTLIKREMKWHGDGPSEGQLRELKRWRIPVPPGATKGDCAKKLSELFRRLKEEREHRRAA